MSTRAGILLQRGMHSFARSYAMRLRSSAAVAAATVFAVPIAAAAPAPIRLLHSSVLQPAAPSSAAPASAASSSSSSSSSPAPPVDPSFKSRSVAQIVLSREQSEGVGARVRRSIGRPELRNFSPFLMLDEFRAGNKGGFPDHPHRGFQTVTYMLPWSTGAFEHQDFVGNAGRLGAGDLQWMSAGRGILHSEMPARGMTSDQIAHGLQLWVNLKSKDKMSEPSYQELPADKVTHVTKGDISARVIAGTALDTTSPVYTKTAVHYIHYTLQPGAVLQHRIPKDATSRGFNAFLYTIDGVIAVGADAAAEAAKGKVIEAHHTVTLTNDGGLDGVTVAAGGDQPANFVLIAGEIIDEPIVQHGPFVMCSRNEIVQAITDFTEGKNGFEGAPQWRSEIGKPITDFLHGH